MTGLSLSVFILDIRSPCPPEQIMREVLKMVSRLSTLARPAGFAAALLLMFVGCRGEHSPGEDHQDHAGHVIPAHKPKSFPEAVLRLRELNDRLARVVVGGPPAAPGDRTLDIALDIATWLPEIAADSEMPEPPWDEVNARSATLVSDYRTILAAAAAGDRDHRVRDAGEAISRLEKLLAAADPRWFAGPAPTRKTDE
jgi:hypothetical protein